MLLVDARFANTPTAAREARSALAGLKARLDAEVVDDITLLVSELVTNSHRHGQLSPGAAISLRVVSEGDVVRVEVEDPGAAGRPAIRDPSNEGGWGLRIVENMASRWGTARTRTGTVVWFELEPRGPLDAGGKP